MSITYKLRTMAERYAIAIPYTSILMMTAADTIEFLDTENSELRELATGLRYCKYEANGSCARITVGGERPFTCCPLYDFDSKEHRCEKLMRKFGIEDE